MSTKVLKKDYKKVKTDSIKNKSLTDSRKMLEKKCDETINELKKLNKLINAKKQSGNGLSLFKKKLSEEEKARLNRSYKNDFYKNMSPNIKYPPNLYAARERIRQLSDPTKQSGKGLDKKTIAKALGISIASLTAIVAAVSLYKKRKEHNKKKEARHTEMKDLLYKN